MLHCISVPKTCIFYQKRSTNLKSKHLIPAKLRVSASLPNVNGVKVEYTPWLIVGLGNPGNKYHGTRHNVGFEMIDRISEAEGITLNTIQSKSLVGIGSIGEVPILLAKPQAYMNFSGESVGPLAAYYQVPLRHILLVYDEMSLPNGIIRLQPKGGHGHHNGSKTHPYKRLIGSTHNSQQPCRSKSNEEGEEELTVGFDGGLMNTVSASVVLARVLSLQLRHSRTKDDGSTAARSLLRTKAMVAFFFEWITRLEPTGSSSSTSGVDDATHLHDLKAQCEE